MSIQTPHSEVERLHREMVAAGDRLLLAISVEDDFNRVNPGEDLVALRKQWIDCRRIVDQFADDYARAINRWREAVEGNSVVVPAKREGWRTSSTFFHRLIEDGIQRIGL